MSKSVSDAREAFLNKVDKKDNGCWEWTGAISGNGYGSVTIDYQGYAAHRVSLCIHRDDIDEISDIDTVHHECRNKSCVRPEHLQICTQRENLIEAVRNDNASRQSVTVAEAREIKDRYRSEECDLSQRELADEFNTNQKSVWKIVNGESFEFLD